jgi:hypothetical protein
VLPAARFSRVGGPRGPLDCRRHGSHGPEVPTVGEARAGLVHDLGVGLMPERGGVQRVSTTDAAALAAGDALQVGVDQAHQLAERVGHPFPVRGEQVCDGVHLPPSARPRSAAQDRTTALGAGRPPGPRVPGTARGSAVRPAMSNCGPSRSPLDATPKSGCGSPMLGVARR